MPLDIMLQIALGIGLFAGGMLANQAWVAGAARPLSRRTATTAGAGLRGTILTAATATGVLCVGLIVLVVALLVGSVV